VLGLELEWVLGLEWVVRSQKGVLQQKSIDITTKRKTHHFRLKKYQLSKSIFK
jgi:hypothetical protein